MQFTANNTTDQIGIHYFSYRVTNDLGHICRLNTGPDVGIDATIEIVDSQKAATGAYVAIQIKTTEGTEPHDNIVRYFDDEHRTYWINHRIPVIFAVVSHGQGRIWLKEVANHTIEKTKKNWKISLEPADEITQCGQALLQRLARPDPADGVMRRLSTAKETLDNNSVIPMFLEDLNKGLYNLDEVRRELSIITQVIDTEPNRYGHMVRQDLERLKSRWAYLDREHSYHRNVEINGM